MHSCWCCGSLLTTKLDCPICDSPGIMSPPHVCLKNGIVISDEHNCDPEFEPLEADHEHGYVPEW